MWDFFRVFEGGGPGGGISGEERGKVGHARRKGYEKTAAPFPPLFLFFPSLGR